MIWFIGDTAFSCTGKEAGVQYADVEDCGKYYVCDNVGNPTSMNCAPGTLFDSVNSLCNFESQAVCATHVESGKYISNQQVKQNQQCSWRLGAARCI